jgi:arginyl-tRNA synthetase
MKFKVSKQKKKIKIRRQKETASPLSKLINESLPKYLIRDIVWEALKKVNYDKHIKKEEIYIEHPQNEEFGDFSTNVGMVLAGKAKKNPEVIAKNLKKQITGRDVLQCVSTIGGFLNFQLSTEWLANELNEILKEKDTYGNSNWGKDQTWLLEHTSPNPNKAMHLGHLRNNVTGMAIGNLWEAVGIKVTRDAIDNNRGIAIAKLMWGYLKFARKDKKETTDISYWSSHQDEWLTPEDANVRPDKFMDELYVKASTDFKENKDTEKTVRQMVVDWEAGNKNDLELWEKVLSYVYKGQKQTLDRLGSKWDHVWHEHEHYKMGKDLAYEGLEKGVFKKSKGAIVTDLKKYGIPDTVVIKSDGTALYITQDFSLTKLKMEKFKPDKAFWVIGPEQSLALKQFFAACEQLGIGKYEDYTHIAYGWMSIKGKGKMSSRLGNVIYIDDLVDEVKNKVLEKIKDSDFDETERENIAEKVALGAIKYSILKVGRMTGTAFDIDESVSFEGDSGPYLQYTYARANSILKESKSPIADRLSPKVELNNEEQAILRTLYKFPEMVFEAGMNLSPNLLCLYLFDLAQKFNLFYRKHKVLKAQSAKLKTQRLAITAATAQVIKNGLELLGIEVLEKM